jgi:hypothetical protein
MDINLAIRLLDVLVENALRILSAGFGVNRAESSFFDVVRLLRAEPRLKEHFLQKVAATFALRAPGQLASGTVPIELIELVAHELRWPELLELAKVRVDKFFGGDTALAVGDIADRLSYAYGDNWQDREFYERYSS